MGEFKVNKAENQFEYHQDGEMAFLEYIEKDGKIIMTHTEAPEALQGTGAAKELVKNALQYSRDNNFQVSPSCPYVAKYIERNPEWEDILTDGYRM